MESRQRFIDTIVFKVKINNNCEMSQSSTKSIVEYYLNDNFDQNNEEFLLSRSQTVENNLSTWLTITRIFFSSGYKKSIIIVWHMLCAIPI